MSSLKSVNVAPAKTTKSTSTVSMNKSAATPHTKKETKCGTNQHVLNAWWVSIGFFLVNVSFNTAQSFATSVDPLLGSISLSLLYFGWIVSLLSVATKITMKIGCKYAMFVCGIIYSGYIFASIKVIDWLYLLSAGILGIAGGPFWVSEGISVQLSCNAYEIENNLGINSKLGYFNGIFTFGFIMSKFGGALAAGIIFQFKGDNSLLYTILGTVNVIGAFSFLFIKGNLSENVIKTINAKSELLILEAKKKLEKAENRHTPQRLRSDDDIGIGDTSDQDDICSATNEKLTLLTPEPRDFEAKDETSKVDKKESAGNVDKPNESQDKVETTTTTTTTTIAGAREDTKRETMETKADNTENIAKITSKSMTNEQCLDNQASGVASSDDNIISEETSINSITIGDTPRPEIVSLSNNTNTNPTTHANTSNTPMNDNDWNTLVPQDSINPSSAAMPKREVKCGGLLFVLIKDPLFKYLIAIGLEWGVMTAWIASDFAALMISNTLKFYILAIEGFVGGVMSMVIGHYIDKIGSLFVFISCNICLLLCFVFLYIWELDQSRYVHAVFPHVKLILSFYFCCAFCFLMFLFFCFFVFFCAGIEIWAILAILIGIGDGGYYTAVPQIFPSLIGSVKFLFETTACQW